MKLNDIKSGYLVELSNGQLFMKMRSGDFDPILVSKTDAIIELKKYSGQEDLTDEGFAGYIAKVYGLPKDPRNSLMFNTEGRVMLYEYVKPKEKKEPKEKKKSTGYIRIDFYEDGSDLDMDCHTIDLLEAISIISYELSKEDTPKDIILCAVNLGYKTKKK